MRKEIIHIIYAEHVDDYKLKLWFNTGEVKIVDFRPYIDKGGIFAPLRDKDFFKSFYIDINTVCWPNGADVAPDTLYKIGKDLTSKPSRSIQGF